MTWIELVSNSDLSSCDTNHTESGIVVLDEFDKLSKKQSFDSRRDVSGEVCLRFMLWT